MNIPYLPYLIVGAGVCGSLAANPSDRQVMGDWFIGTHTISGAGESYKHQERPPSVARNANGMAVAG